MTSYQRNTATKHEIVKRPPKPEEELQPIIRSWNQKHTSDHVPTNPFDGASWWIQLQEKPNEYRDKPEKIIDKDGNLAGWKTPYNDRLVMSLRAYLDLTNIEKAFVVDRVKAGIPYRGDKFKFYKSVCEQHELMMKNKDAYIGHAAEILKAYKGAHHG